MFETLVFYSTGAKLNRSWFFRSPPKPKYSKVIIHLSEQVSHQDIPDFGGRNSLPSIHLRTGVAGLRLVGSYYRDWEENAVKPAHRISQSGSHRGFTLVECFFYLLKTQIDGIQFHQVNFGVNLKGDNNVQDMWMQVRQNSEKADKGKEQKQS